MHYAYCKYSLQFVLFFWLWQNWLSVLISVCWTSLPCQRLLACQDTVPLELFPQKDGCCKQSYWESSGLKHLSVKNLAKFFLSFRLRKMSRKKSPIIEYELNWSPLAASVIIFPKLLLLPPHYYSGHSHTTWSSFQWTATEDRGHQHHQVSSKTTKLSNGAEIKSERERAREMEKRMKERASELEKKMKSCYYVTGSHRAGQGAQWAINRQHNRAGAAGEQHYEPDPGSGEMLTPPLCSQHSTY